MLFISLNPFFVTVFNYLDREYAMGESLLQGKAARLGVLLKIYSWTPNQTLPAANLVFFWLNSDHNAPPYSRLCLTPTMRLSTEFAFAE